MTCDVTFNREMCRGTVCKNHAYIKYVMALTSWSYTNSVSELRLRYSMVAIMVTYRVLYLGHASPVFYWLSTRTSVTTSEPYHRIVSMYIDLNNDNIKEYNEHKKRFSEGKQIYNEKNSRTRQ